MIFRWLLRRSSQRDLKRRLPGAYEGLVVNGHWDWISGISEWRAFRILYFPMSVVREIDPQHLQELQKIIGKVLVETEDKKDARNTSA